MARTRTLAQLREDVLWQADRQGTALRIEAARVDRAINQSIAEFREHVSERDPYFLRHTEGTLSAGATSPHHFGVLDLGALDPAHHRIYGFDIQVQSEWISLDPVLFQHRNQWQAALGSGDIPQVFFQYERDTVAYAPAAATTYPYQIWDLPVHEDLVNDADTFDGLNGWEEFVTFSAVAKLLLRDRDAHLERFEAERNRLLANIISKAPQRQRSGPIIRGGRTPGASYGGLRGRGSGHGYGGGAGSALNQPGTGEVGRVAIARSDGRIDWLTGSEEGDDFKYRRNAAGTGYSWQRERGWIVPRVDLTGATDATAEIQRCLNLRPGACVKVPDGKIRLEGALTIPHGCTLTGDERSARYGDRVFAQEFPVGARFDIRHTAVAFTLQQEAAVRNCGVFDPTQVTDATPLARDYWFDCSTIGWALENLTLVNPYQAIHAYGNGGRIDNVVGYPLSMGVYLGRCADVIRVSNVHWNPTVNHEFGSTLLAWVQANLNAFVVDGAECFNFTDCFAYGGRNGLRFIDTDGDGFKGSSGSWKGGGLDLFDFCVRVSPAHGLSATGLSMSDCSLVTTQGGTAVQFLDSDVPAADVEKPGIWLTDVHGNSAGTGMARMIWMTASSYGKCVMKGGAVLNVFNEVARNDSSNGFVRMRDVFSQSGDTRTGGTGALEDVDGETL